jgi:hypothetical protein
MREIALKAVASEKNFTLPPPPPFTATSTMGMLVAFSKAYIRTEIQMLAHPGYGIFKITTCKKNK